MAKRFLKRRINGKLTVKMEGAMGGKRWMVHPDAPRGAKCFEIDSQVLENCNTASASNMRDGRCIAVTVRIPEWQAEYLDELAARAKRQSPQMRGAKSAVVIEAIDLLAAFQS